MKQLKLALGKAKLLNEEGTKCEDAGEKKSKKAKIDVNSAKKEHTVTCGANIKYNTGHNSDDDNEGRNDDKVITFSHDLEKYHQDTTNNADLLKKILTKHGLQNSTVYDLTYGDGKFWREDVINDLQLLVRFDRFKNRETNPQKYGSVHPLRLAGTHTEHGNFFKGASVIVIDPPYTIYGGKHNARNCNLSKSASFLKFASAYGIDVQYTVNNIVEFYINCFEIVDNSLYKCDNGEEHLVLVKCMDFDSVCMTEFVGSIAACRGYRQVASYPLKKQGQSQSMMLCYQRMSSNQRKNCFLRKTIGKGGVNEALSKYKKRSAENYKERANSTIIDTRRWLEVCATILNMGINCRPVTRQYTVKLLCQYGWVKKENGWRSRSPSVELGTTRADLQEFYRDRCFECTMVQNCCYVLWHDLLEREYNGDIPTDRDTKIQYAKTLFDKTSCEQLNTEKSHNYIKENVKIVMKEYFEKL